MEAVLQLMEAVLKIPMPNHFMATGPTSLIHI